MVKGRPRPTGGKHTQLTKEKRRELVLRALQGESRQEIALSENVSRSWLFEIIADARDNAQKHLEEAKRELDFRKEVLQLVNKERSSVEDKMGPLDDYLKRLREETGQIIPDMSPLDGGAGARVLLLLNYPTPGAKVIGRENPDATATNVRKIHEGVLDRKDTISWNAIPYFSESPDREIKKCRPYLLVLLERLPELRVAVLCGNYAKQTRSWIREARPDVVILETWHPTQQNFNLNKDKEARGHYTATIEAAAAIIETEGMREGS